jgi:hypothetical protein
MVTGLLYMLQSIKTLTIKAKMGASPVECEKFK